MVILGDAAREFARCACFSSNDMWNLKLDLSGWRMDKDDKLIKDSAFNGPLHSASSSKFSQGPPIVREVNLHELRSKRNPFQPYLPETQPKITTGQAQVYSKQDRQQPNNGHATSIYTPQIKRTPSSSEDPN